MNEINNQPKGIPAWLSITITLGLVFIGRAIAGDAGMWLIFFGCSIWMWIDAKKRDLTKLTGMAAIKKPFIWFICGVGLFVISFPVYLTKVFKTKKPLTNSIKVSIVSVTVVAFLAMLYFAGKAASYVFNPTSNHWLTELKPLLLTDIDSFYCPENFTTLKLDVKSSSLVTYEKTCNKNDNTGYMAIGADEKKRIVQIQHVLISKNTECTATNLAKFFNVDESKIKDTSNVFMTQSFVYGSAESELKTSKSKAILATSAFCKANNPDNFTEAMIVTKVE